MKSQNDHRAGTRMYLMIFVALLVGTALTVAAAFLDLGRFNNIVALGIATLKAALVVIYFMHIGRERASLSLALGGGVFLLIVLIAGTIDDTHFRQKEIQDLSSFEQTARPD